MQHARRNPRILAMTLAASAASATLGSGATWSADFAAPVLDRWMYPFNATPGARIAASTFGSEPGAPDFDSRDGQMLVAFATGSQLPTGRGDEITVTRAVLEVEVATNLAFIYDPTPDAWQTFLAADDPDRIEDLDAGQPVECFGVGFRNGWSAASFQESSPYTAAGTSFLAPGVRNAFAATMDAAGTVTDVSQNPRQRFGPAAWATGTIEDVAPGEFVPAGRVMRFELAVDDPGVQRYLREGIDAGRLFLSVSSLTFVEQQAGQFPSFVTKENALVPLGLARAPRLVVEAREGSPCIAADLDCDGAVNGIDLGVLLGNWGPCAGCAADLNGDGDVNGIDLGVLLGNWG